MDYESIGNGLRNAFPDVAHRGLSKRELFAAMILQGALGGDRFPYGAPPRQLADRAVQYADALLEALQQTP